MKKPLTLTVRSYAENPRVSVWLTAEGVCLHAADVLPQQADRLAEVLQAVVAVERERSGFDGYPQPDTPDEFYSPPPRMLAPDLFSPVEGPTS